MHNRPNTATPTTDTAALLQGMAVLAAIGLDPLAEHVLGMLMAMYPSPSALTN